MPRALMTLIFWGAISWEAVNAAIAPSYSRFFTRLSPRYQKGAARGGRGVFSSAITRSQGARRATGSAVELRQVSISPAARAGAVAASMTRPSNKARNIVGTLQHMDFGRRARPPVHCGKGGPRRSSVTDRPCLRPCAGAALFTNSCGAGRNNPPPPPFFGHGRELSRLRNADPALDCPQPLPKEETMSPPHLSHLSLCAAAIGALAIAAVAISPPRPSEEPAIIPPPAVDVQAADGIQTAVIAGGCFWGVQGVYQHTAGVLNAGSGDSGGSKMTANYTMLGPGTTGHPEAVEIKYDPKKISYGKILQIFFSVVHDPTQLNRQ